MQTQAIDNRAMNYKNAQQRFRVEKFEMDVKHDHIQIRISSSVLKDDNYRIDVKDNKLRLILTDHSDIMKSFSLPAICDLYLPKTGLTKIGMQAFEKGTLTLKLLKSPLEQEPQQRLVRHTA